MAPLNYICPAVAVFLFQEEGTFLENIPATALNPVLLRQETLELRRQNLPALSGSLLLCGPTACSAGAEHSYAL